MHRCRKVYYDRKNGHFSFAIVKNTRTKRYLLLNFTSIKHKANFNKLRACKFSEADMCRIVPQSISKSAHRFDSYIPFNQMEPISESDFASRFNCTKNHQLMPYYVIKILKELRKNLKGDILKEFNDYV